MAYLLFAAYRWHGFASDVPIGQVRLPLLRVPLTLTAGHAGAVVLAFGGLALVYYLFFMYPRISDFLIESEGELRKVTWPSAKPWFKASTELWGATYVVIAVVVILAVFTWLVDYWIFRPTLLELFFGGKQ